jgi:hypothetical protein
MLIACEFRAKRLSEGRSFLTCADDIFTFTSKERLGEVRTSSLSTRIPSTTLLHFFTSALSLGLFTLCQEATSHFRCWLQDKTRGGEGSGEEGSVEEGRGEERAVTCGRSGPDHDVLTNTMS